VNILIADDHPMIRTAIEALLRGTDYEIAGTAGSGEETLRLLDEARPDMLLLDLQIAASLPITRDAEGGAR